MSADNGGPAFPVDLSSDPDARYGMSLRDYFAAHIGMHTLPWNFDNSIDRLPEYAANYAKSVYAFADAMIAQRSK